MSSDEIVIDVRNLGKRYEIYASPRDSLKQLVAPALHQAGVRACAALGIRNTSAAPRYFQEFWALHDVSFQVRAGETLGIVGRNGSGKSTLLQLIAGTLNPTEGEVRVDGRVAALLELGSGFNPDFTGRENVYLNGRILGLTQQQIEQRFDEIEAFADIGEFIDQPVKTYSSGMFVRLAFSVQAHIDASIVIIDEALAVGDVFFRQKCYARLDKLRESGSAILLVSHAMTEIEQFCERAILLDHGRLAFTGPAVIATKHYYLLDQRAPAPVADAPAAGGPALPDPSPAAQPGTAPLTAGMIRPEPIAFVKLDGVPQVGTGAAACVALAICDSAGRACNTFKQGDKLLIHYEFAISQPIEAPICGAVLTNDRGVIVHGKNTQQHGTELPLRIAAGSTLVCQQEIELDVGIGEYTLEVGLGCLSLHDWMRRAQMPHEQFESCVHRLCHLPIAGTLSVGFAMRDGVAVLTHHGAADLPGTIRMQAR